jgi:tRNA splicing ligase
MDGFVRNDEFRKIYTIYGSRNTKVAELLPDELMDFILKYRKKAGEIYLSVIGKNCYVAIGSKKDILEPKLFQSNVSYELVREFYEDIDAALYMIMALDRSH